MTRLICLLRGHDAMYPASGGWMFCHREEQWFVWHARSWHRTQWRPR